MKALAVAVLGLAAGSVMACPSGPTTAGGGAWSSSSSLQGTLAIVTPGLNSTGCKLSAALNPGASTIASAYVVDNTPANETRYRARF